jgi:hypothetical protein
MDRDEAALLKEDNDGSSMANEEAENKHDCSEVFSGEVEFTVGKSPGSNNNIDSARHFGSWRGYTQGNCVLCYPVSTVYERR